jgi:hypothetical protein
MGEHIRLRRETVGLLWFLLKEISRSCEYSSSSFLIREGSVWQRARATGYGITRRLSSRVAEGDLATTWATTFGFYSSPRLWKK